MAAGSLKYWWTCHLCQDRMQFSPDEGTVKFCRDEHIRFNHPGWKPPAYMLSISHWYFRADN